MVGSRVPVSPQEGTRRIISKYDKNDPFDANPPGFFATDWRVKSYLDNLPIYRDTISIGNESKLFLPKDKGYEIGLAHGYFLLGPFYILGPMRNAGSLESLFAGFTSTIGLILILTIALTIYGIASFGEDNQPNDIYTLYSAKGWQNFTISFLKGALGSASFATFLLYISTLR